MGYTTKFVGSLDFTSELNLEQVGALEGFFNEDVRDHPEWETGDEYMTYIDLEFTKDRTGIQWTGAEKTYGMVSAVNLILDEMRKQWPGFGLRGSLKAQGEEIGDVWELVINAEGRAEKRSLLLADSSAAPLTFAHVSATNLSRSLLWHKGGLEEWSVSDWACAMAGEAGEVCNAVKKLNRIDKDVQQNVGPQTREQAIADIAKEIGDTFMYLDLLAQRLGIDIEEAIRATFNRISEREGFPQRL